MTYDEDGATSTPHIGPDQSASPSAQWYPAQSWGPPRPTNGLAITSMVLGIIWIYWVGSILALIFGYIARQQIRERGESGYGMAVAGITLGWGGVGVLSTVLLIVLVTSLTEPS